MHMGFCKSETVSSIDQNAKNPLIILKKLHVAALPVKHNCKQVDHQSRHLSVIYLKIADYSSMCNFIDV